MAAPTLTDTESKRFTIRSKTTKKKPSYKNVLVDPFKISWPILEEAVELEIIEKMKSTFSEHNLGRTPKPPMSQISKEQALQERIEKRKKKREERKLPQNLQVPKEKRPRPLVFGLTNVMRCLEKDELRLVCVCRDVNHTLLKMTHHLIPLCVSRGCPAVCLSALQTQISPALSMSSLLALGIKKKELVNESGLDELVDFISERCKPLDVPWLVDHSEATIDENKTRKESRVESTMELSTETIAQSTETAAESMEATTQPTETDAQLTETPTQSTSETTVQPTATLAQSTESLVELTAERRISCQPDFSDLYIKKDISESSSSNQGSVWSEDFIHFGADNESDDEVVTYTLQKSSKTREVNPNGMQFSVESIDDIQDEIPLETLTRGRKRKLSDSHVINQPNKSKLRKAQIKQKVPNPNKKKRKNKNKKKKKSS